MKRIDLPKGLLDDMALQFRIGVCEALLRKRPDSVEILMELGNLYTQAKRFTDGLKVDLKLVKALPKNPVVHYNLACSYSLLGEKEKAFEALEKAVELGFADYELMSKDEDLQNIRGDRRFRGLLLRCIENGKKGAHGTSGFAG